MKIRKDDTVLIIAGKDRGKKGKVLHAFPKEGKLSVEGVNLLKKHVPPEKQRQQKGKKRTGQIVEFPGPVDVSNVKLVCPKCSKAARVGKEEGGRVCKKCNQKV